MHSSSHLGVSRIKSSGRFLAKIQIDGKIRHVGTFCDEEEAAAAYRAAEAKIQEDPSWMPSRRAFSSEHVRSTPLKNGGDHSFGSRFRPLRNRPPVFWCHFLESWRQDGENREKTRKNGAKMGEIWPKKKSVGCPSIIEGSVSDCE